MIHRVVIVFFSLLFSCCSNYAKIEKICSSSSSGCVYFKLKTRGLNYERREVSNQRFDMFQDPSIGKSSISLISPFLYKLESDTLLLYVNDYRLGNRIYRMNIPVKVIGLSNPSYHNIHSKRDSLGLTLW